MEKYNNLNALNEFDRMTPIFNRIFKHAIYLQFAHLMKWNIIPHHQNLLDLEFIFV